MGAFKFRGACNAVLSLSEWDAQKGLATHSSGNHAAALSFAARKRGVPAYIVMPENSPEIKKKAVAGYGGQITYCEPTLQARETTLEQIVDKTGAVFIPSYNHPDIIAGQGTAALEFIMEIPGLEYMIVPVGGGGLLSGTALSVKKLSSATTVIAGEPKGADDAYQSMKEGKIIPSVSPTTIADGLLTSLGDFTFTIIKNNVDDIITVKETSIIEAMRIIWERMKIIVEPSAAVPFAVVLENKQLFENKKTGMVLTGGNVDLERLPF